MTDAFRIRPYRAGDEAFVVHAWLWGHARSDYGKRWNGASPKTLGGVGDHYWTRHRPVVLRLLRESNVVVACDADDDDVLWGFASTDGPGVLHYVAVHHAAKELAAEIVEALIPKRMLTAQLITHEQTGLRGAKLRTPREWLFDEYWLASKWSKT